MPPHIAGREREQAIISESLEMLANSRGPRPILMIGPRGCGKTVLIEWCREEARKTSRKIRIKELIGAVPGDLGKLASNLVEPSGGGFRPSEASAKLNVGIASADMHFSNEPTTKADFVDTLVEQCSNTPLLLVIDEAARKSPEGMGVLLELTQVINRRSNSILLVIAGTPGTTEVLRASGATFFDRAKGMNIGLLSPEESRAAIVEPLSQQNLAIDESALESVVEECQGFPFFLQEWGKALYDEIQRNRRHAVLPEDVQSTTDDVRKSREQTYESRYDEWRESDIDLLARVLRATHDARSSGNFTKTDLLNAVSQAMKVSNGTTECSEEFTQQILNTGCLWKPLGGSHLISGLPSFIDHVLNRARLDSDSG